MAILLPSTAGRHIRVVEGERDIAELIALHLSDLPANVTLASDGPRGLELALRQPWDAIVLDIRLPGLNGLGADDYLTKPFSVLELQARVKALLRRSALTTSLASDASAQKPSAIEHGRLRVDRLRRRVWLAGWRGDRAGAA